MLGYDYKFHLNLYPVASFTGGEVASSPFIGMLSFYMTKVNLNVRGGTSMENKNNENRGIAISAICMIVNIVLTVINLVLNF